MSFDSLRTSATEGDHERLRDSLVGIANTCTADEYGITPLMYAVWNGHTECVKLLVSNDMGVSASGQKRSSLDMQSSSGYTALHLAAMDCPEESVRDITFILMAMRVDVNVRCKDSKTAIELATQYENNGFIEVYKRFMAAGDDEDDELNVEVEDLRQKLAASYAFRPEATLFVKPFKANFPVPKFIFKKDRLGSIPYGMTLHEAHIEPLINCGYDKMRGANSIRCLEFAVDQASINEERRKKLVKTFDKDWEPPNDGEHVTDSVLYKNNAKKK